MTHPASIAAGLPAHVIAAEFVSRIGGDLLTVPQVAEAMGRTSERIGQVIRAGGLPGIHVTLSGRGAYLVRREDVVFDAPIPLRVA